MTNPSAYLSDTRLMFQVALRCLSPSSVGTGANQPESRLFEQMLQHRLSHSQPHSSPVKSATMPIPSSVAANAPENRIAYEMQMDLQGQGATAVVTHDSSGDLVSGRLSARFESGAEGIAAIGYDPSGGTSYGAYQIASKPGTMDEFLDWLDAEAPDISNRLRAAGPADTGGRGGAMPSEWREIAAEEPALFGELQQNFIREHHYEPARQQIIDRIGMDINTRSGTLQEALWSAAVQHGPSGAARIFATALATDTPSRGVSIDGKVDNNGGIRSEKEDARILSRIFAEREKRLAHLTPDIRNAVIRRYESEHKALSIAS